MDNKKKWGEPRIINLSLQETEEPSTYNFPHSWHCTIHGALVNIVEDTTLPESDPNRYKCPVCGRVASYVGCGEHPDTPGGS